MIEITTELVNARCRETVILRDKISLYFVTRCFVIITYKKVSNAKKIDFKVLLS